MTEAERVIAYVDGQLDAAARAKFEAEMAANPSLARQVESQRALRERIAAAYAPVVEEPVPERLSAAAASVRRLRPRMFGPPAWAAMAAMLALGVFAGSLLPGDGPLAVTPEGLTARGALAQALDGQLAAESEGRAIKVGLTFRDRERAYCRTFESPADRLAGVACREDGRWRARMTAAYAPMAGTDYRTAASEIPLPVLTAVDAMIEGEAFDAGEERAARDRDWTD